MITQSLLRECKQLQSLELQDYKKVVNYTINLILNHENQMKLNQFIQIQQQKGDNITRIAISLITALVRYRTSPKQFQADLTLLPLAKDKKQFLKQKIKANLYEIRKIVYAQQLADCTHFKGLDWRYQLQIASKISRNQYIPNIFLNLQTQEKGVSKNTAFTCDFANLKYLHATLSQAIKMHGSNKFKIARNSSI